MAIQTGIAITSDDLETVTLPGGVKALRNNKTQRYVAETARSPRVKVSAVLLNDDGDHIVARYRNLDMYEIDRMEQAGERNIATAEMRGVVDAAWQKLLSEAKLVPVALAAPKRKAFHEFDPYTLDDFDRFIVEAGAAVKVVRGSAVLATAPDPEAVSVAASLFDSDDFRVKTGLVARANRHLNSVRALVRAIDDLGDLAVKYVKDGKRPKADFGKGTANRVGPGGIWLT